MAEEDRKEPADVDEPKPESADGDDESGAAPAEQGTSEGEDAQTEDEATPEPGTESSQDAPSEPAKPADEKPATERPKPAVKLAEGAKPAAAVKEKQPEPEPPKTTNDDTTAFAGKTEFEPEQVADIRPSIPAFRIASEKLVDAMRFLHDQRGFDHLACITAIDWKEGKLEVVYNLWSYAKNRPFAVRVAVNAENPVVPSVMSVWKGADWLEREEFDLMGIQFRGHPDLRRIMLPEGWQGHPLRKDYDIKREQFVGMDSTGENVVYQESREDAW